MGSGASKQAKKAYPSVKNATKLASSNITPSINQHSNAQFFEHLKKLSKSVEYKDIQAKYTQNVRRKT